MKLKPLHDWAVIVPAEAGVRSAGGLYLPDTAKEQPSEGVVEAIGPGALEEKRHGRKRDEKKERKFIPTTVKPGDRVLYDKYTGQKVSIDNEDRILVRERDILGLLPQKPAQPREELPPLRLPLASAAESESAAGRRAAPSAGKASRKTKKAVKKAAKAGKKAAKKAPKKGAKKPAAGKTSGKARKPAAKKTSSKKGPAKKSKKR